jgi:hypothetical protein
LGPLRRARCRRLIEEGEERSAGCEPPLDDIARTLGVAVKETHANREDLVEAAVSQVEVLEDRDEELGPAGLDVRRVSVGCGLNHLRRAVDRGEMSLLKPLANERRRDPVPAPDLEHQVIGPDVQLLDDRSQSLTHDTASWPVCSTLVEVAS